MPQRESIFSGVLQVGFMSCHFNGLERERKMQAFFMKLTFDFTDFEIRLVTIPE